MKKDPFLYVATFLMDGLIGVIGLCVPLLALRLGASYDDLGAIGAVSSLVYALACLVSGRLSERLGYRRSMALASAAEHLGPRSPYLLCACAVLLAVGIQAYLHRRGQRSTLSGQRPAVGSQLFS